MTSESDTVQWKQPGWHRFIPFVLVAIAAVSIYTWCLQNAQNESMLEFTVAANRSRTDAMHQGVENLITRGDFTDLGSKADIDSPRYQRIQKRLNEIRNMNSARYFYTAKRNELGQLVYVVDGLNLASDDIRYPGDLIEPEVVPFIAAALDGRSVYSQDIIDTDWGHIFTAAYPVRAKDGTNDIIGALVIETDMEPVHRYIAERSRIAAAVAAVGCAVTLLLMAGGFLTFRRERRLEAERRQALEKATDAARAANEAKSAFLFNMSHDIRTPMNAIIGYAELAQRHLADSDKLGRYLENIQVCGKKLLVLLNDVLDLARIENNKTAIEMAPVKLADVVESSLSMFRNAADKKHLELSSATSLSHPYVFTDEVHYSEILMNILSNALKYTPPGGRVSLTVTELPADDPAFCRVRAVIADTGVGMSEEFLKHIFEAFSRERTSTASGIEGTGLGMGIVKRLVDLMKGEITVTSELGKGSVFTVTLPCRIARAEDAVVRRADEPQDYTDLTGRRVLLAEDNDLNAEIALELLAESGIQADRAADGVDCVALLEKAPAHYYDAVLMDIQMPVMNGYDAARKIRRLKDAAKAKTPIIAMTANAFSEDRAKALASGMNDHVAKPIDMNVLLPALRRAFVATKSSAS